MFNPKPTTRNVVYFLHSSLPFYPPHHLKFNISKPPYHHQRNNPTRTMSRVTRSSKKAVSVFQAEPESERNALHVIDNNSTPEAEQQPVEALPAKRSTRAKKGKENAAGKPPAKSKKSKRGKKGAAQKRDVVEGEQEVEVAETIVIAEETEIVDETKLEDVEDVQKEAQTAEHPEDQIPEELITQEAPVLEEVAPQKETTEDETVEEEIPQKEIQEEETPEKEVPREECESEQPQEEETAKLEPSVTLNPEDFPEQQASTEADQSVTPHVDDAQQDACTDEPQPSDINDDDVAISAELQRMADEMHESVNSQIDEAAIETEIERMSQDAQDAQDAQNVQIDIEPQRPQTPERRQTVLRVTKTPKFDPEVHGNDEDFEDPGNDSFELHVSPRKKLAGVPSKETEKSKTTSLSQKLQKPVVKTKKAITTKPKVEKTGTIAPKPSVTVKKVRSLNRLLYCTNLTFPDR